MFVCLLFVCIQTEKKTEELYKKQQTAVFKSATERLALSLLAKVSLLPSRLPPSLSLSPTQRFCCKAAQTYFKVEPEMKTPLHAKFLLS